jgi:hypothetical protein
MFIRKFRNVNGLFNGHFMDVKAMYVLEFDRLPCVAFIGELDTTKAYAYIREEFKFNIRRAFQHTYYDHAEGKMFFNNTIFVLDVWRMIELENDYCHVLHATTQYAWAYALITKMAEFKKANDDKVIGFTRQARMN